MDDFISRQAAIDALTAYYHHKTDTQHTALHDALSKVPSAHIDLSDFSDKLWRAAYERGKAEVVRCKDCKYCDRGTDEDGKLLFKCLGWGYGGTSEDDFCSHGERNKVPTARARWEYVDYGGIGNYHCSRCRAIGKKDYEYCPRCGARMDGERYG